MPITSHSIVDSLFVTGSTVPIYIVDPTRVTVISSIIVSQNIVHDDVYQSSQSVSVSQEIITGVDTNRSGEDDLEITQSVQGVLIYNNRNSGQTGSAFLDPSAQIAYGNLTPTRTVTFSQSGTTVTLRAPDWGDRDKYEVVRIQEESRGKTLIVYQDSIWPKTEILSLTFSYLTATDVDNLLTFLISSIGRSITYIDHFGRTWIGYILNPDAEVRQTTKSNRTISIDFQGVLQ